MEVIPNIGIGPVRFGMTPSEVLAHFPEEQTYEDWMGGTEYLDRSKIAYEIQESGDLFVRSQTTGITRAPIQRT